MSDINQSSDLKNDTHDAAKKVFGRDPLPVIRWINLLCGLAILVFGIFGFIQIILNILSFDINFIMVFFFSLYQL